MLPLVITVRSVDGSTRRYAFAESPVSIGRSPFAELQLTEPFVSRWEGTIRFDEHEVTYFILGTTNPTYVDGRPLTEREQDVTIATGSVLAIGELELRFTREPVPDADLRRKGKRPPAQDDREAAAKTMFLDAAQLRAQVPARRPSAAPGTAGTTAPGAQPPRTSPPPPHTPSARPPSNSVPPVPATRSDASPAVAAPARHEPGLSAAPSVPPGTIGPVGDLYRGYREAWSKLLLELTGALERTPEAQRSALAEQIQRSYPRIVAEPEFRAVLKRLQLPVGRSEVPEVREWLLSVGQDVLPPQLQLDTGLTLERIFRLLEILTQSLAEINSAQDSVRSRWLGRAPRRSVLRSENGRVVLAYLLNPKADWGERVAELEQTIRDAVTHELALFKATLEAARKLVESISPEAMERAEQSEHEATGGDSESWWRRLVGGDPPESRLWRRLVATHEALLDGNRYQRFFLGRMFAHSYLAAMGQSAPSDERGSRP